MSIPQLLIAAPHSGSGKTLFTLALLRLLNNRGLTVQPFKCGPDYLDTQLHKIAARRDSYNLDLFMSDSVGVRNRFARQLAGADVAIVEGVMGMFDGYHQAQGSSAEIAMTLDIPVVLIVNAKAMAHSAAALLKGFATYQPGVKLAGVVFNFVGSNSHYSFLKAAAEEVGVEPLGWIGANGNLKVESRHLGLQTENQPQIDAICEIAAQQVAQNVDIDRLLALTSRPKPHSQPLPLQPKTGKKIAVAKDAAFSFIYPANIEALEREAEVVYFSPLASQTLPDADFIYLPGGYPELYAKELSANTSMIQSINKYCHNGGHLLAECGGMIYLGKNITLKDGSCYPMASIFDFGTTFMDGRCTLGYRQATIGKYTVKGHEFHYSRSEGILPSSIAEVYNAMGNPAKTGIFSFKNTIASYFHIYWGDSAASITKIVDSIANELEQ